MKPIEYGRTDLSRFVINENYSDLTTHAVAAKMLADIVALRAYYVVDPSGGPVLAECAFHFKNALEALDYLAEIGGERLVVSGTDISFMPAFGAE